MYRTLQGTFHKYFKILEVNFGNSFGSMETILKAPSILCQFPNHIASMLNFKNLKEQTPIHAPHTHAPQSTSSSPWACPLTKQDQHYCIAREILLQKNTHCEPYAHIGSLHEHYFLYEIIIFVGQKWMNLKFQYIDPIICHINDFNFYTNLHYFWLIPTFK